MNVNGVFLCMCVVILYIDVVGGGLIVNLLLMYGIVGGFDVFVYYVLKVVVWMMVKVDVMLYVVKNICVNLVYFGYICMLMFEDVFC